MNYAGTLRAGQSLRAYALGFLARSVLVHNMSGQWYYVPELDVYIPPYTTQWTQPYPSGTQTANLIAQTPSQQISNPLPVQTVSYQFVDTILNSFAGITIQQTFQSQDFNIPAGSGGVINLPFTARSVVINNLTGQWYYLLELDAFIPPYTNQYTAQFPSGSNIITLQATTPVSQMSNPIAGESLTGRATEEILASFSGVFTRGLYQVFSQTANAGNSISTAIGFTARSVAIDNPTGQWYRENNTGVRIAPYMTNVILNIPAGAILADVQATTPTGNVSNPVAGQSITVIYTDEVRANNPGIPIQGLFQTSSLTANAGSNIGPTVLGFTARSVSIDNPTGQWYLETNTNTRIPPYTTNLLIEIPSGATSGNVTVSTPTGSISNPVVGQVIRAVYTDETRASNPGVPNQQTYRSNTGSAVAGSPLAIAVGFTARSVVVNNLSGQWYFLTQLNVYIPPYTAQYVATFPSGIGTINFTATTPASQFSNPVAGETIFARATEEVLEAFSGVFTRGLYQVATPTASAGNNISASLLFLARSVKVDNPTGQWYNEQTTGRYISPYTTGVIIALAAGTSTADIQASTPVGLTSNPLAGQTIQATYTDEVLPDAAGVVSNPVANVGAQELASYSVTATTAAGLTLTPITQKLLYILNPAGSNTIIKIRSIIFSFWWQSLMTVADVGDGVVVVERTATVIANSLTENRMDTQDAASIAVLAANFTTATTPIAGPVVNMGFSSVAEDLVTNIIRFGNGFTAELLRHYPAGATKPLTLRPGEAVQVRVQNAAPAARSLVAAQWTEEPLTVVGP